MITIESFFAAFVTSLGITIFIKLTTHSSPYSLPGYFVCAFAGDMLTPAPVEFLSLPVIMIFLVAYIRWFDRKSRTDALYIVGASAIVHIFAVIVTGLPLWNAIPEIYETGLYNIVVGIAQLLLTAVFAIVLRNRLYLRLTKVQIHWLTVGMYGLAGYLTVLYPILIRLLHIKYTEFCRILTNLNSLLCIVILALGVVLIFYLEILKRQEDRYETLYESAVKSFEENHSYHSKFRTIRAYIYSADWNGLIDFAKNNADLEFSKNNNKEDLEQIKCEPLKAVVRLFITEVERRGLRVDLKIIGEIDNIKMEVSALCDVFNLYAQNCLVNCIKMQTAGMIPKVELIFEQKMLSTRIEMRNTVANEAAALDAVHKKQKRVTGHGYGLALTKKIVNRQSNCTLSISVKDGWFIEKLLIRTFDNPQIKENEVEKLAVRHGEQLLEKDVEKGSLEYEAKINQVKFLYFNLVKLVPFLVLTAFLHIFWETVAVLLLMIPLGSQAKGIHFESDLGCFLYSITGYLAAVYLSLYLPLTWYAILGIWIVLMSVYWQYAPYGHSGRPILQREAKILKKNSVFLLCIYGALALLANLFLPHWAAVQFLYTAMIYVCVVEGINLLPLTYKIFHVRRWE